MSESGRRNSPDGSRKEIPKDSSLADATWSSISYILGGMAVYGGLGWLVDRWTGHSTLFLPIGLIVGVALSLVLVYVRHGRS
ncbi:AtpZ/AtpI family protein [Yinghuangia seranimata]|uniref:AtpZ/AtpI family protein n=1 Tax=Yinghuangia seranimata TaxID=408067 RepID=UPI00248D367B|nr:AtpZ/AtpI family protein [Yinghuangia seranimata]MDI2128162.1 AtpZ/AtpI family protein [Yinghuangia seranimata]